jgi:hypothetical protein
MSEKTDAIALANRLMEEPNMDPDDDLRVLSRQLLRSTETIAAMHKKLQEVDWDNQAELDMIEANRDSILRIHEEGIRRIEKCYKMSERRALIEGIIYAVNTFHPMHGESWCGWPEGS